MPPRRSLLTVIVLGLLAVLGTAVKVEAQTFVIKQRLEGGYRTFFGTRLALDGDIAVVGSHSDKVGANDNQGAAYVYVRSGTTWTLQQRLIAADGTAHDSFGVDVAVSGTTIVVGAEFGAGFGSSIGAAYIFVRNGTTWVQQTKLTASNAGPTDLFGQAVDIDGDIVVIGARNGAAQTPYSGAAYVYERLGTTWTEYQLPAPASRKAFGASVAISGNTICVGSPNEGGSGATNRGAAYVYERVSTWNFQRSLAAPDGAAYDAFGGACDVDGDTVVVGAPDADAPSSGQGAAYVFTRGGGNWPLQQKLVSAGGISDHLATGIDVHGDRLVLGAPTYESPGHALVFDRTGTTWAQTQRIQPNQGVGTDGAGYGIAFNAQWLFIGSSTLSEVAIYSGGSVSGTPPGQARNFQATVSGNTVHMAWDHPVSGGAPTGYMLRARAPGGALIVAAPLGLATTFGATAPNGVYVLTVQATNPAGAGQESSARTVTVPMAVTPPGAPANLAATVAGSTITFTWAAPSSGGAVASYVLLAGTTPGFTTSLAAVPLPIAPTAFAVPGVPAGSYYVRLLAQNSGGLSAASNEILVTVGVATAPAAPTLNAPTVAGHTVGLSWSADGGGTPTGYTLVATTTPGGTPLATVPLSGTSVVFAGVPSGSYYLTLTASNAAGVGPPSNQVLLVVP